MKAVEFESTLNESGKIMLPPELADEVPLGRELRVIVMWEPSQADVVWRDAGRRAFESAYSVEDSIYEQLLKDAPAR